MKISNYFAKEKMDDTTFIQTFIEKLNELTDEDICWANSDLLEDNENVQSLLMEMVLSFYAFILISVPMLWFVQNTISEKVRWVPQVWIFLLYGNAILQGILNILFHIPFVYMLFLTHIMLFSGVISMICLLWKE